VSVPAPSAWPEWIDVCAVDDITPDTGVAVLIGDLQIAIVRVGDGDDQIFAVGNYDPFSHAFVIARGIVGDANVRLPSYPTRVREGRVSISVAS
jgi:nitrite reductase/ring-hydroxylating ferredoxin subunit